MTDTSTNIIIEDNNAYLMAMGDGSQIIIEAADAEKESWTQLASTATAGSSQLVVEDDTGWEIGDVIAIASTDEWDEYEEFTILDISDDGTTITLDGELENTHEGVTLTYDNGLTGDDYMEWTAETRAEVALLSRNVTIQGDEDSAGEEGEVIIDGYDQSGYGGHTMVMDGAEQYISGAEYYRMGQEGIVGSYPVHFHLLDDAEGQYITNVSIHDTYNKGTTIHGTSNVLFQDNVIFNTSGHGLFLEDGAESGNQIIGNLIFATTASDADTAAIPTDATDVTSYWIENPDNILIDNVAAGSEENGFWIFPDNTIHGTSAEIGIGEMGSMSDLIFQDNVSHSNGEFGVSVEGSIDADTLTINRGGIQDGAYGTIEGLLAYENDRHGLWLFTNDLIVEDSMFIDNDFGGVLSKGGNYINDSLFAENNIGLYLYTVGGTELNDVHFEGNDGDVFVNAGTNLNSQHAFSGITTGDGETLNLFFDDDNAATNQRNIIDVDGSITGIAGATITSDADNYELSAAPNAYYDDDLQLWVSEATVARTRVITDDTATLNVTRSDGVSVDDYDYTTTYSSFLVPTASGLTYDVAYLLDFEDSVPTEVRLTTQYMQDGESVVYEIPNVDSIGTVQNATEVASLSDLMAATSTSYIIQDDSVFVRVVAEASEAEDLAVDELLADYNTYSSVVFSDIVTASNFDSAPTLSADLLTAIDDATVTDTDITPEVVAATTTSTNDDFVLETYESTADPTVVTDDMARWSDTTTWDGGTAPGADDIVVIGEGETVILDQTTTVEGIIVNGGELIIEDDATATWELSTDYLLVMEGGLFQAGYEADPLDTDFTLTLEGDDPDFDLEVTEILSGNVTNTIFAAEQDIVVTTSSITTSAEDISISTAAQLGSVTATQSTADTWFEVTFDQTIEDAVVVMGPISADGGQSATTQIRNVTDTGFEFQINEWDYLDGTHVEVDVSWIAASAGDYTLEDGRNISFGSTTAQNETETSVDLTGFDDTPLVFTQVSDNDGDAVTSRVTESDADSFSVMMQEEEAADSIHDEEDVYWFAVEEGDGTYTAQNFELTVNHNLTDLGLIAEEYIFGAMQSANGGDTAAIRYDISADGNVEMWLQEEQSSDTELAHLLEDVGLFQTSEDFLTLAVA